jgi:hypothetical protein
VFFATGPGGNSFSSISGCELSTAWTGNIKLVRQITGGGFWDTIYKGPIGRLTGGLQYSFTQKFGFAGIRGAPERNENTFFTSLRYYPF